MGSGSAGNIMDHTTTTKLKIPFCTLNSPPLISTIDSGTIQTYRPYRPSAYTESITFMIMDTPKNPIILFIPWLHLHDPQISWNRRWFKHCVRHCLTRLQL